MGSAAPGPPEDAAAEEEGWYDDDERHVLEDGYPAGTLIKKVENLLRKQKQHRCAARRAWRCTLQRSTAVQRPPGLLATGRSR